MSPKRSANTSRKKGPSFKLDEASQRAVYRAYLKLGSDETVQDLADTFEICRATVYNIVRRQKAKEENPPALDRGA